MNAGTMGEPVNPWIMETGSLVIWSMVLVICTVLAVRSGRLSLVALCLIGGTTSFWQEFFGDWGAYLAWNPHFARLPFWGEMPYTTPVKPLFIPFSWGYWFALTIPLFTALIRWLGRKLPRISTTLLSFAIVLPLYSLYEISAEGTAVGNGWWTYDLILGPTVITSKGMMPIIFPICLGTWAAGFVAYLLHRDANGFWWHDRLFGVRKHPPGVRREFMRAVAFTVLFQISFVVVNILPPIVGRLMFGGSNALVP
jgi:hypothetical protein